MSRHPHVHPLFQPLLNAIAPAVPHSTPVDAYPDWRKAELAAKYNDPHEWDAELNGDGQIDDVELEGPGMEELL